MSISTNIFSLTKLFEDGHVMEISLEFERRAKAYNELLAENERLRKAGDAMWNTAQQDGTGLWLHKSFEDWHKMNHPRTEGGAK